MKRRKFLKFLALIPALPIACQGWPFKPKSKPPPIDRYEPPKEEAFLWNGDKYSGKFEDYLVLSPEMFKEAIKYFGR